MDDPPRPTSADVGPGAAIPAPPDLPANAATTTRPGGSSIDPPPPPPTHGTSACVAPTAKGTLRVDPRGPRALGASAGATHSNAPATFERRADWTPAPTSLTPPTRIVPKRQPSAADAAASRSRASPSAPCGLVSHTVSSAVKVPPPPSTVAGSDPAAAANEFETTRDGMTHGTCTHDAPARLSPSGVLPAVPSGSTATSMTAEDGTPDGTSHRVSVDDSCA